MELTVPRPLSDTASARHPAIPRVLWMYVWIVAGLGIGPLVWSIATLAGAPPDTRWLLLVGLDPQWCAAHPSAVGQGDRLRVGRFRVRFRAALRPRRGHPDRRVGRLDCLVVEPRS